MFMDWRVARYTHGHDVTISARPLGRFERIVVMGRLVTLLEMEGWEQTQPHDPLRPCA